MVVFDCHVCRTRLSADEGQAGQLVRCPTCLTTLRVPASAPQPAAVAAGNFSESNKYDLRPPPPRPSPLTATRGGGGKRYGFNCGYCSSRLEATEAMGGQDGQCPTCGNNITIPILDRYGRLIDPKTRQIIKQDPHPVHAYAAAGDRAPKIIRQKYTKQIIVCPRCNVASPITANYCNACCILFTMEVMILDAAGSSIC